MPEPHAVRTDRDGVITVTFNRPEKLNAVSVEMREVLWEAVRDLGDDPAQRALLVNARGRYFTAGIDLAGMGPMTGAATGQELRRAYRALHLLMDEIEAIEKPVILAAQGPCLGFGVEFASSCDFRLASDATSFGLPEINIAVIPGSGGVSRFTRLVGPSWGKYVAMTGRRIDAARALAIGFVQEVWPAEEFEARVDEFVRDLVALPAEALGVAKLAVDAAASVDRTTARDVDRLANTMLIMSDDHRQRVEAFLARSAKG